MFTQLLIIFSEPGHRSSTNFNDLAYTDFTYQATMARSSAANICSRLSTCCGPGSSRCCGRDVSDGIFRAGPTESCSCLCSTPMSGRREYKVQIMHFLFAVCTPWDKFLCNLCAQWTAKCAYILLLVTASSAMGAIMLPAVQRQLQATFRDFRATCTDLNILGRNCLKMTGYMASYKAGSDSQVAGFDEAASS